MKRRDFLATGLGLAAAGLCSGAAAVKATSKETRRNVLFLSVDDLRPELGCYGQDHMLTPNIDQLAKDGALFTQTHCQAAACAPSRVSVMSGVRPSTSGAYYFVPLREKLPDVTTLPEHFKRNGYQTFSYGKIYHYGPPEDKPSWSEKPWIPQNHFRGYMSPENQQRVKKMAEEAGDPDSWIFQCGPATEAADLPEESYPEYKLADRTIETLRNMGDQPFFLGVGFIRPHLPFTAPKKYWDLYDREALPLPDNMDAIENAPKWTIHPWRELRTYQGTPRMGDPMPSVSKELARELIHGYCACVSYVDAQIGRILKALEETGLAETTTVVLWGDHGFHLGEHDYWAKGTNLDVATRTPMILRLPGQKKRGLRIDALTELVDIYPTLCDASGIDVPDHVEGLSVVPLLDNPERNWKSGVFSQYPRWPRLDKSGNVPLPDDGVMGYAVRTKAHRYVEWVRMGDRKVMARELYDYATDPHESINVAGKPEYDQVERGLARLLNAGWREALPPGPG